MGCNQLDDPNDRRNFKPCINECHHGSLWCFLAGIYPPNLYSIPRRKSHRSRERNDGFIHSHVSNCFPCIHNKQITEIRIKATSIVIIAMYFARMRSYAALTYSAPATGATGTIELPVESIMLAESETVLEQDL